MLALQLGELRPRGIDLVFSEVELDRTAADTGLDLVEVPLRTLLEPASQPSLVGLPVFPARDESERGPLTLRTVIALRREIHETRGWVATALLDAFEAAREAAYSRLKLATSPALALPWLIDGIAADESRFAGDPFPVGFAANRTALERVGEAIARDGVAVDLEAAFAPETIGHLPAAEAEAAASRSASGEGVSCRALRYLDRTLSLESGAVSPRGTSFAYLAAPSLGRAFPAVCNGEVEIAEVLLGDLVAELAERADRVIGLPVFPARRFAQRYIWVKAESGLDSLTGLNGRRIGFPPGAATAAAWARALLERHGIEACFEAGPVGGRIGQILDRGAGGTTLPDRLAAGDLDALITPYAIPPEEGGDRLRLLLSDPAEAERAQARDGGLAPISNVLAMNRAAYERNPGAVPALLGAFARAREAGARGLLEEIPSVALPRLGERVRETAELFGREDPYPYGVEANREDLRDFTRNAAAIGCAAREVELAELFPPEAFADGSEPG